MENDLRNANFGNNYPDRDRFENIVTVTQMTSAAQAFSYNQPPVRWPPTNLAENHKYQPPTTNGNTPLKITCQYCSKTVLTNIYKQPGKITWTIFGISACLLVLIGAFPAALILMKGFMFMSHRMSNHQSEEIEKIDVIKVIIGVFSLIVIICCYLFWPWWVDCTKANVHKCPICNGRVYKDEKWRGFA